jgi:hypothetical protein
MTTPKPVGKTPTSLPVTRPVPAAGFDGGLSHDELLETARGVSAHDETKIIERKRADVNHASAELTREKAVRDGRRRAFLLHLGGWGLVSLALAALASSSLGASWLMWPLALWSVILGAHGAWLVREQDRGVRAAEARLTEAEEELAKYVSSAPPRVTSSPDEGELRARPRA